MPKRGVIPRLRTGGSLRTDDGKPKRKDDYMDIANANNVSKLHVLLTLPDFSELAPVSTYVEHRGTNQKSQKARRKDWCRLSNAPKAVRRLMGFKER